MTAEWLSLWTSLRVAAAAGGISVVVGLWFAYILRNREFAGKRALGGLLSAAIALPAPVVCYYVLAVHGRVWSLTGAGLVIAGVVSAMPIFVRGARGALAGIDPAYGKAARSLGASEWRVFSRIDLPLAHRPILAAAGLAVARVLAELAAAYWIAERLAI